MSALQPLNFAPFKIDDRGLCERTALFECTERSHTWSLADRDKASALLRIIFAHRANQHALLLSGANRKMYQALVGPWCRITGIDGEVVYPELRWCDFSNGIVCYRAGLDSPLSTHQFERHREQLEELWQGPVAIATGASVGAAPGAVVVRPAPAQIAPPGPIPPAPRAPVALPDCIPLINAGVKP
ncbi:hypothetical protein DW352_02690 [Pseudolabrys taiwanensis]|jgi:hypothetical protein|uniref:Uncharacterized protein n=1 Tax=Pseudolabrys taiwanensis TaxID=331696 RepID=A0A345ZRH2_9HYPH|nr:hypothetical protein [Pseudolabrys taiwanensis]AXK79519.1 hypothetical protein DW352_02690 [Pseudolabrys taiwanensis]